jgi:hypothetical protein
MHAKNIFKISFPLLLTVIICISCTQDAQNTTYNNAPYDYPVRPGTDEWGTLGSSGRYEACQIPEDILKKMSTKSLVETVLDYPLLIIYRAHNDMQMGFDILVEKFNGLRELYTRKDCGTEVLKVFLGIDPAAIDEEWSNIEKGRYVFDLMDVEMLLMQEPVCESLTDEERLALVEKAESNRIVMESLPELYSTLNINSILIERATTRQYSGKVGPF